jgi:hypothetical protein
MEQPLHDDLMIGAEAIAKFTGQSERRVFHMLAEGQLPGFKLGNKWAARRSRLQQHIIEREAAAEREAAERKAEREAAEADERKAAERKRKATERKTTLRKATERDGGEAA